MGKYWLVIDPPETVHVGALLNDAEIESLNKLVRDSNNGYDTYPIIMMHLLDQTKNRPAYFIRYERISAEEEHTPSEWEVIISAGKAKWMEQKHTIKEFNRGYSEPFEEIKTRIIEMYSIYAVIKVRAESDYWYVYDPPKSIYVGAVLDYADLSTLRRYHFNPGKDIVEFDLGLMKYSDDRSYFIRSERYGEKVGIKEMDLASNPAFLIHQKVH